MKITLSQAEIEQAITTHINALLTIAPGTVITIDLGSPRGSTEVIATIDLSANGCDMDTIKAPEPKAKAAPKAVPTPVAKAEVEVEAKAEVTAPAEVADPVPAQAQEAVVNPSSFVAERKISLFSNLAKPRND